MKPSRRQFLQSSSALLGASSLLPSAPDPRPAERPKGAATAAPSPQHLVPACGCPLRGARARCVDIDGAGSWFSNATGGPRTGSGAAKPWLGARADHRTQGGNRTGNLRHGLHSGREPRCVPKPGSLRDQPGDRRRPFPRVRLSGATPQAVLYAVFDFLERQGAFFGLDGEVYPLEPAKP